jgi:hypothetical protein
MRDYDNEKWVQLYASAMLELQQSLMSGRIHDARTEILKRIEKLREIPGLHTAERQSIEDALSGLRSLEKEMASYEAEQDRQATYEALKRLKSIEPTIRKLLTDRSDEN